MAVIQSGVSADLATVDSVSKALRTTWYNPDGTAFDGTIKYSSLDPMVDSFERLRVSEPRIVWETNFARGINTNLYEATAVASGTATSNINEGTTTLSTTTAINSGYWIQSLDAIRYAPGISTIARFTFNMIEKRAGIRKRVGLFSDYGTYPSTTGNGIFLEVDGTAVSIVRRSMTSGSGYEERVYQADWNKDKHDGTGASGVSLDWTKSQHLVIEYQWLGVGAVRVGFESGSHIHWAHEFVSVNALDTPYTTHGNFSVRAEIHATTALASAGTMKLINCAVIHEGDVAEKRGYIYRTAATGTTAKATAASAGALIPLLSIRNATTDELTKRARIIPVNISAIQTAATAWRLVWVVGATLTGGTFAALTSDAAQIDTAATAVSGGVEVFSIMGGSGAGTVSFDINDYQDNLLRAFQNAAGTGAATGRNTATLVLQTLSATAASGFGVINWKEIV